MNAVSEEPRRAGETVPIPHNNKYSGLFSCWLCFFRMIGSEHSWGRGGGGHGKSTAFKTTSREKSYLITVTRVSEFLFLYTSAFMLEEGLKAVWRMLIWVSMEQKSGLY